MSSMSDDALNLVWILGAAALVAGLVALLGRRPGQRRR
jgi:hypothetical protein